MKLTNFNSKNENNNSEKGDSLIATVDNENNSNDKNEFHLYL